MIQYFAVEREGVAQSLSIDEKLLRGRCTVRRESAELRART